MASNTVKSVDTIPAKGCDRPALKLLNRHVKKQISSKWYDLGLELLEQEDEETLHEIEINHPNDASKCCLQMLQLWLKKCVTATWNQLIKALRDVDLYNLATAIEGMLMDTGSSEVVTTSATDQQQLQPLLKSYGSDSTDVKSLKVNFDKYDDVSNAFDKLFTICQNTIRVSNEEFKTVRNLCILRASEPLRDLMKHATDSNHLFEILAVNNKYCNWMNVNFLKVISIACHNEHLLSLIKNYTDVIYSKSLREVWDHISHYSVRDKYYSKLKATFSDKDPDNMTVKELMKSRPQLANEMAMLIAVVQWESLLVTWLIPTDEVYQAYLSFLTIPQQSRMDEFVQFGNWMAYLPKNVLQKYEEEINCGAVSIPTLLIGYYHGLLLRDINADLLIDEMCSMGLLADHEQAIISSGHTMHHRNWLLLEYVRLMDLKSLLTFCELLQKEWPEISLQLITAVNSNSASLFLSKAELSTSTCISCCQCDCRSTTNASIVLVLYFHLTDQLVELLKSYDHEMMMEQCSNLMASDQNNIKLFTSDQLKIFNQYSNAILLRTLCFFTWSNCSILRSLTTNCSEAVKLLYRFESNLDPLQPIACYPIPHLSTDMIPRNSSTYTILAVRCDKELYHCTLQYIYDIQSIMIEKCDITQHCLQLLAVRNDPSIFYWTIPKCVVDLINTNVPLHSEYLYSRGILEVLVYSDLFLTTGDDICYGSLAFECVDTRKDEESTVKSKQSDRESLTEELQKKIEELEKINENLRKEKKDILLKVKESTFELSERENLVEQFKKEIEDLGTGKEDEESTMKSKQSNRENPIEKLPMNIEELEEENEDLWKDKEDALLKVKECTSKLKLSEKEAEDLRKEKEPSSVQEIAGKGVAAKVNVASKEETFTDSGILERQPTLRQLLGYKNQIECEWYNLGKTLLGEKVEMIKKEHSPDKKCNQMLRAWVEGMNHTWGRLIDALKKIDKTDIAKEILQKLQSIPEKQPTLRQLNNYKSQIRRKWYDLGKILLGEGIENIKKENPPNKHYSQMLRAWIEGKNHHTWGKFIDALKEVGRIDVAEEILQKFYGYHTPNYDNNSSQHTHTYGPGEGLVLSRP